MNRRKALKSAGLLAGASIAVPSILNLLQSCERTSRPEWQPQFFTENEAQLIGALADMILPATSTPGALDVNVDIFIDTLVAKAYAPEAQQAFRDALNALDADCLKNKGDSFVNLNESSKKEFLSEAEQNAGTFNPGVWGTAIGEQKPVGFYRSLKSTMIWAFFSSEQIGKNILSYDPIPGAYHGCIPVSEVGNRWSL
ncbi:gluconate 2-dehydrogenase subunit 3 family protein [Robiginitalea sp.]|nr:gluconate 2-dehydrogenase subunit 3 family protein [Robiginitalea sp.]